MGFEETDIRKALKLNNDVNEAVTILTAGSSDSMNDIAMEQPLEGFVFTFKFYLSLDYEKELIRTIF